MKLQEIQGFVFSVLDGLFGVLTPIADRPRNKSGDYRMRRKQNL